MSAPHNYFTSINAFTRSFVINNIICSTHYICNDYTSQVFANRQHTAIKESKCLTSFVSCL